ncbi:acyltransferase [Methylosinus sp. C49]|uniref:acyltransferase family protein n=1 Tax=Methylosinus sp. C49 TaxID=2699395 RepID=UPI001366E566|nr:acyltransferase [Methylosinus sp. C49]BBU62157.1 acyltransferase [Methylosinus sp. C49]
MRKWLKLKPLVAKSGEMLHLDALRFLASLGIVFHHSKEFMLSSAANERSDGLALFVDMFFIISGYVISYVYFERIHDLGSYGGFLKKRVARLFPLHLLTLVVSAILYAGFSALQLPSRHTPSFSPLCIADTALLLHTVIECGNHLYFNGVNWSISVEMMMYLAFPITLILARSARQRDVLVIATICIAIIFGEIRRYGLAFSVHDWIDAGSFHPLLRGVFGFGVGVALFRLRHLLAPITPPFPILAGGLLAILAAMLAGQSPLLILALIVLLVTGAVARDVHATATPSLRRIAPFGQLTYSIYMWHNLFILVFINIVGDKLMRGSGIAIAALTLLCYVLIFATSLLSFHLFETPMRRAIDRISVFGKAHAQKSRVAS